MIDKRHNFFFYRLMIDGKKREDNKDNHSREPTRCEEIL